MTVPGLSLDAQVALVASRIVHRDATLVAVDKPPGFVSAGPPRMGRESIESLLVRALGRPRVWTVHQLDRDTSGLNLFVLSRAAVAIWVARMKVEHPKRYLAVTHGVPPVGLQRIEAAMADRVHAPSGKLFPAVVPADAPDAKASVTEIVRVVASASGEHALVEVRPLTGRTHQVRVHLAHIGCPLVGEHVHRPATPPDESHPRHALHAWRLTFEGLALEAPFAPDLQALCERLGIVTGL